MARREENIPLIPFALWTKNGSGAALKNGLPLHVSSNFKTWPLVGPGHVAWGTQVFMQTRTTQADLHRLSTKCFYREEMQLSGGTCWAFSTGISAPPTLSLWGMDTGTASSWTEKGTLQDPHLWVWPSIKHTLRLVTEEPQYVYQYFRSQLLDVS